MPLFPSLNRAVVHCRQARVADPGLGPGTRRFRNRTACVTVILSALLAVETVVVALAAAGGQDFPKAAILSSDQLLTLAAEIAGLSTSGGEPSAVKRLIAIDDQLADQPDPMAARLQQKLLRSLADTGTDEAREYLRAVFETQTLRRHDAAAAISVAVQQRSTSDQDWRYLVRSLTVVEGEQAVAVMRALQRFRRRATRPAWVRQVILVALTLPEHDLPVALGLLRLWTQYTPASQQSLTEQLAAYQRWFRRTWPAEPDPVLPIDAAHARWTADRLADVLADVLAGVPSAPASGTGGAAVYVKAGCHKCHRRGSIKQQPRNDQLGPDLTSLGWRRQPREILTAILYPSHHLNDDYPVTTVVLQNGKSFSGLLMADDEGGLKVVSAAGTVTRFAKTELLETRASKVSQMPAGLLEPLSRQEIGELLVFLSDRTGHVDPHAPAR